MSLRFSFLLLSFSLLCAKTAFSQSADFSKRVHAWLAASPGRNFSDKRNVFDAEAGLLKRLDATSEISLTAGISHHADNLFYSKQLGPTSVAETTIRGVENFTTIKVGGRFFFSGHLYGGLEVGGGFGKTDGSSTTKSTITAVGTTVQKSSDEGEKISALVVSPSVGLRLGVFDVAVKYENTRNKLVGNYGALRIGVGF